MTTIRRWHFEQLRYSFNIVHYIMQTAGMKALTIYHDDNDGWTIAEVIGHLLDCERLFLKRAKLTMIHDCPELPFPDQNEDVIKGRYNERNPQTTFAEWQQARNDYLAYLATIPDDGWTREGKHPKYTPLSLNDQLFLAGWHDLLHIDQMTRILTEKRI